MIQPCRRLRSGNKPASTCPAGRGYREGTVTVAVRRASLWRVFIRKAQCRKRSVPYCIRHETKSYNQPAMLTPRIADSRFNTPQFSNPASQRVSFKRGYRAIVLIAGRGLDQHQIRQDSPTGRTAHADAKAEITSTAKHERPTAIESRATLRRTPSKPCLNWPTSTGKTAKTNRLDRFQRLYPNHSRHHQHLPGLTAGQRSWLPSGIRIRRT